MGMRRETTYKPRPMALPVSRVSVCAEHMKDNLDLDETRFFMSQGKSTQNVRCLKGHSLYSTTSAQKYNKIKWCRIGKRRKNDHYPALTFKLLEIS